MEEINKEVRFDKHCKTCKHADEDETFNTCHECLSEPVNAHTDKPVRWEKEEK